MNRADPRTWGINQKLAFLALALGALALLGAPSPGGAVTINTRELADIVESEVDHVTVEDLADWIVQDRADYRLLDVRDPESYAAYHIPTARRRDSLCPSLVPTAGRGLRRRVHFTRRPQRLERRDSLPRATSRCKAGRGRQLRAAPSSQ